MCLLHLAYLTSIVRFKSSSIGRYIFFYLIYFNRNIQTFEIVYTINIYSTVSLNTFGSLNQDTLSRIPIYIYEYIRLFLNYRNCLAFG